MSGRHAVSRVVAEPEALAQLERMLDDAPRTDPKRARALAVAHRRRAIAWSVHTHPAARGRVHVPVPAVTGALCEVRTPHELSEPLGAGIALAWTCSRPAGHGGRHAALSGFVRAGETSFVYGVWSGGAR